MERNFYSLLNTLRKLGSNLQLEGENISVEMANGDDLSRELRSEIIKYKDDLILFLKRKKEFYEIPKISIQASYPISDAQRRLWVLSQFEQGSIAYNMYSYLDLKGYDIDIFRRSISSVLLRHEVLRTVFREGEDGEVRQYVLDLDDLGFVIGYEDYRLED
ncbi:condensation domain-containing protein, partial [Aquimarina algiphila]|uniref:condensation domain-containing protein n=1 Tax=Aquimarina algiphila TaxID=2047982 RepID=UPI00232D9721